MSLASSSRQIEFRNATLGATVAICRLAEPPLLADELHKMLGGMPDFFGGEATVLDFSELSDVPQRVDWAGLLSLFRRFQLQPIGVRNLPDELVPSARHAGLSILDAAELHTPAETSVQRSDPTPSPESAASAPQAIETPSLEREHAKTLFVDRPLRSGQQVYARDGDIVLLAGMSNGAEVIADGSIHCYGPLRGRAIAGAQGDASAQILTTNFGPEIVSVAGVYTTFEQGIAASLAGKPVHVRILSGDTEQKLAIEPLALD